MTDKQAEARELEEFFGGVFISQEVPASTARKVAATISRLRHRVVELEAELAKEASRTANQKTRADQMSLQHDHQAALNRDARNQLTQLTAQLEAIGAGGVESLRKK